MRRDECVRDFVEDLTFAPMRWRHARNARPKYLARQRTLATTRDTLQKARSLGAEGMAAVFDVGLYVLLFDQDLADFTDLLIYARGERRRKFVAKYMALLLYEVAEDLQHLLGRRFREGLHEISAPPQLLKTLNAICSELNRFWEAEQPFLQPIRHNLSAHREAESLQYLRQLEALEPLEVMRCAADLSAIVNKLVSSFGEVGTFCAGPRTILADMSASRRRPPPSGGPSKRRGRTPQTSRT